MLQAQGTVRLYAPPRDGHLAGMTLAIAPNHVAASCPPPAPAGPHAKALYRPSRTWSHRIGCRKQFIGNLRGLWTHHRLARIRRSDAI